MNINDYINEAIETIIKQGLPLQVIVLSLLIASLFNIIIYSSYRFMKKDEFYSKDFNMCLVIVSLLTCSIVLTAQSNIVTALGIAGALSIVKFRTAIKSPLDLAFIFWSASSGIICGYQSYKLNVVLSIFIFITLIIVQTIDNPSRTGLIVIHVSNNYDYDVLLKDLKSNTSYLKLKTESINQLSTELVFEYKGKKQDLIQNTILKNKEVIDCSIINYDKETK